MGVRGSDLDQDIAILCLSIFGPSWSVFLLALAMFGFAPCICCGFLELCEIRQC